MDWKRRPLVPTAISLIVMVALHVEAMRKEDGERITVDVGGYGSVTGYSYPSQYEAKPYLWINTWLGIPYAKRLSQFGTEWREKYRFMNPEKASWYGEWDATYFRPSCPQMPWLMRETIPDFNNMDEDCLYLNVYAPRIKTETSQTSKYPVLVFFHGGGFIMGSAQQFPGHFIAERLVVVVTVNYRLNALGFLSTGDRYSSGNYGMFDQIQAMQFIKENIASFRGNPSSITIMGHSSGAASVGLHMISLRSENLFNQAIMMSGSDLSEWAVISRADSVEYSKRLAMEVGCPSGDSQRLVDCLRYSRSFSEIVNASARVRMLPGRVGNPWGPVVDGPIVSTEKAFLSDNPLNMRRQGRSKRVKLLAGLAMDDGAYFIPNLPNLIDGITTAEFDNILREFLDYRNVDDFNNVLSALQFQYTYWPIPKNITYVRQETIEMMSDFIFGSPMNEMLEYQVQMETVYFYVFKYRSWNAYSPSWRGVSHGEELQYVFGFPFINETYMNLTGIYPRQEYDYPDRNISEYMISMLTNFTYRGNPTPRDFPIINYRNATWLEYNLVNHSFLSITNKSENAINYRQVEFGFWREYFPVISGRGNYLDEVAASQQPLTASVYEILTYALAAVSALLLAVVVIVCCVLIRRSKPRKY